VAAPGAVLGTFGGVPGPFAPSAAPWTAAAKDGHARPDSDAHTDDGSEYPAPAHLGSSRVAYSWHWPDDVNKPGRVPHSNALPPVPELVSISVIMSNPADLDPRL
jgi:hypothetical protein